MAKQTLTISSVLGGISPNYYGMQATITGQAIQPGQYLSGTAIDPNAGISNKISGGIVPTKYATFSSSLLNDVPVWLLTNPKNSNVYAYLNSGRIVQYTNQLLSETAVPNSSTFVPSTSANGAAYYNNYLYLFANTDVSRYGPLDNSPTLTNSVWTGSTLGSQTALTNPGKVGSFYPNHVAHEHFGSLYFCDVMQSGAGGGQGIINRIATKKGSNQGDTNDNSAYNVLDLPFGYVPSAIESFGEDLIIAAVQTSDGLVRQGSSALFLWNTIDPAPYRKIPMSDPLVTALLNVNGVIHIWAGALAYVTKHYTFNGGYSVTLVDSFPSETPPGANTVDAIGDRVVWAGANAVYAKGYTHPSLPQTALNCIAVPNALATNVTALKYALQDNNLTPQLVLGWSGSAVFGLDSQTAGNSLSSQIKFFFNVGQPFNIKRIRAPLLYGQTVTTNVNIPVTVIIDGVTTTSLTTINFANYPNASFAAIAPPDGIRGANSFILQFGFTGSDSVGLALPITIDIDTYDEYTAN